MKKRLLSIAVCLLPLLSVAQLSNTHIEANVSAPLPGQTAPFPLAAKPKVVLSSEVYEQKKMAGTLDGNYDYTIVNNNPTPQVQVSQEHLDRMNYDHNEKSLTNTQCDCLVPLDGTFSVAEFTGGIAPDYRNDDGSTASKALPFTFCLYGTNYNNFFINNNGNISFGSAYGTFTATGFPSAGFVMAAPFWADVDTRNAASGLVYYKITPTYAIVKWQQVGYFPSAADKVNTFQVIITDGSDPILSNGANIAFCYGDMQWTTGSASGGSGGFGGTAATAGVNKGDGINFAQIGRFDQPGSTYNGTTTSSGVSWLDNQSFFFSTCSSTNIPPIVAGLNNCDTIRICGPNDSLILSALFLSPESSQSTTITVNLNGTPNSSVLSVINGNVAFAQVLIYAGAANYGNNVITFTATDNGIPVQSTVVNTNVFVDTTGLAGLNPVISGVQALCQGSPTTLSVSPTTYDSYLWNTGSNGTSITVTTPGQYWVTSYLAGCVVTNLINVVATPGATFSYVGTPYCQSAADPSPTYSGVGAAGTFTSTAGLVINPATGVVNLALSTPGTYTVTNSIPAQSGCPAVSATSTITITAVQAASFSYVGTPFCQIGGVNPSPTYSGGAFGGTFTATPSGLSLDANTGVINSALSTPGTYTVTNTIPAANGCPPATASTPVTINAAPVATFTYLASPYCKNGTNPSPTFFGGGIAGTFTATPAGLSIVPNTGAINLAASNAGTYTVTNTIAATGPCPAQTATATVTITALPVGTFSYIGSPYCHGGGVNPAPTFSGSGVGGTFTSTPAGLVMNALNGVVNTTTSTVGTYTVTNTIAPSGGCPAVISTSTITIIPALDGSFSYVNDPYCQGGANPFPTLATNAIGGVYSGDPGLIINSSTGEVDLTQTPPGTYTVNNTVPAQSGCLSVTGTTTISITELPSGTFEYPGNPFCQSAGIVSANFIGNGQPGIFTASSPNLILDPNTAEIDVTGSVPGTYWVYNLLPASDGCPDVVDSAEVTIILSPVATFSYINSPYCVSGTDPSPTFSGGGTAGTFTSTAGLVIDANTGTVTLSTSTPGTYTVTNTVSPTGCPTVISTATITINTGAVATFSYTGSPYCVGGANPSPTFSGGGVAGTFSSTSGLVIDANTGVVTLSSSTPGTYTVTNNVTGTSGCPNGTATTTITIASSFVATFSYTGTPYCQSGINPLPTFSGGGAAGAFSSTSGLSIDGTTGLVDLALSTPGTYTVTNFIATSGGCPSVTATSTITITVPFVGTFSYAGSPYCTGGVDPSPTFSGGGIAGTFTSTPGLIIDANTGLVTLASSTPGTYTVTNTIAPVGGCPQVIATAIITIGTASVATFSYTANPYCQNVNNPAPTFSGGGVAGTFSSTPGLVIDPVTGIVTLSTSIPGTYTVTNDIAASGGCNAATASASITIVAPPVADFSYAGSPYCQAGTDPLPTYLNGGVAGTFSSTAGLTLDPVTGLVTLSTSTAGTYTVTNQITSSACGTVTSTATIVILGSFTASFNYPAAPYCQNATDPSPTFIGGGVAGTFTSTTGLTINPSTGLVTLASSTPGTYMVINTVSSPGCTTAIDSSSITIVLAPLASFSYTGSPYCQSASNPSPTFTGAATAGAFTSTPVGLTIDGTTGVVDLLASTPGTYTVTNTVTGTGGCPNGTATSTIIISAPPVSTFSYTGSPYCQNAPNPNPTFSGGGVAGTFTSTGGLSINAATGVVNLLASSPGTYTVTNVVNSAGCPSATSSASITITLAPIATFNYTGSPYCQNDPSPLPTFTGGGSAGTFTATGGLVVNSATGLVTLTSVAPGTYTITNTIAAAGGCPQVVSSTTITITALGDASFTYPANTFCQTSTTTPTITSAGGGFTSTPAGLSLIAGTGQINLASSNPGTYTITYTSPGSCSTTSTQQVTINAAPAASAGSNQTLACGNGTVTLAGTGASGATYSWAPSGGIVSGGTTLTPVVNQVGTYTLTVTDNTNGCVSTDVVTVTSTPGPVASYTANPTSGTPPLVVNFFNASSGATSYLWLFPGGNPSSSTALNPTVTYSTTGTYTATLIAANGGCTDTTTETIIVFDGYTLMIPNIFSPNGDLSNDFFTVISTGVASFSGQIYDRWGVKMYDWVDVTKGWDGVNMNGGKANDGTYYYIITSKGFDGSDHTDQGFFMLVR